MSLKQINNKFGKIIINEKSDISNIAIPFSKVFKINKKSDIYSGTENIPFNERDPEYKKIFRQEFTNRFNIEFKVLSPVVKFAF